MNDHVTRRDRSETSKGRVSFNRYKERGLQLVLGCPFRDRLIDAVGCHVYHTDRTGGVM